MTVQTQFRTWQIKTEDGIWTLQKFILYLLYLLSCILTNMVRLALNSKQGFVHILWLAFDADIPQLGVANRNLQSLEWLPTAFFISLAKEKVRNDSEIFSGQNTRHHSQFKANTTQNFWKGKTNANEFTWLSSWEFRKYWCSAILLTKP